MLRNALTVAMVSLAVACSGVSDSPFVDRSVSVTMPSPKIEGLHRTPAESVLLPADAAADAVNPGQLQAVLEGAGLIGVSEETYAGARGTFSRVVIRGWQFTTSDGAGTFFDWIRVNATHELIGEAAPISSDRSGTAVVFMHEVSGCCHEEVPIYLAAWQRTAIVWTIRASGSRIHTAPVLELVRSVEREV